MNVITIESEAFQAIIEKINSIEEFIIANQPNQTDFKESWIDGNDVCNFLNISQRTLQRLRK